MCTEFSQQASYSCSWPYSGRWDYFVVVAITSPSHFPFLVLLTRTVLAYFWWGKQRFPELFNCCMNYSDWVWETKSKFVCSVTYLSLLISSIVLLMGTMVVIIASMGSGVLCSILEGPRYDQSQYDQVPYSEYISCSIFTYAKAGAFSHGVVPFKGHIGYRWTKRNGLEIWHSVFCFFALFAQPWPCPIVRESISTAIHSDSERKMCYESKYASHMFLVNIGYTNYKSIKYYCLSIYRVVPYFLENTKHNVLAHVEPFSRAVAHSKGQISFSIWWQNGECLVPVFGMSAAEFWKSQEKVMCQSFGLLASWRHAKNWKFSLLLFFGYEGFYLLFFETKFTSTNRNSWAQTFLAKGLQRILMGLQNSTLLRSSQVCLPGLAVITFLS